MLATETQEEQVTIVAAEPLTDAEHDALLSTIAASDKIARVRANSTSAGTVRGVSLMGNVD